MKESSGPPGANASARRPLAPGRETAAGLALVGFGLFALWAGLGLPFMTRGGVGSGLMPRLLAGGLVLLGLAQLAASRRDPGPPLEIGAPGRGFLTILAVLVFAAAIRGAEIGPIHLPGLGLAGAGPLAVVVAGLAAPDARPRELAVFALLLTAGCVLLFRFALGLPIPVAPWLIGW